ncbi:hypothetical protein VOLCADRAFT_94558 [Volvox carteri f. nagariensis]|uniref:Uncharacterized protein n=1 Tax=Volvox carteri f. nagariensis TaxID=3068 RepID=D8U539_VOLCA|nr:uncharacterized protein VOLCADRAFT_94558 [Volvox carteri f. nagariensis]EFJ45080.1 hypothetical protein VOLCADRAFT_94558 [Volvox carteri f. nagariensis]|eukprot:XP_002953756.1 hypothetical protein VOLCADRAFT_94558 [Volvox carteri f. nagariensis]
MSREKSCFCYRRTCWSNGLRFRSFMPYSCTLASKTGTDAVGSAATVAVNPAPMRSPRIPKRCNMHEQKVNNTSSVALYRLAVFLVLSMAMTSSVRTSVIICEQGSHATKTAYTSSFYGLSNRGTNLGFTTLPAFWDGRESMQTYIRSAEARCQHVAFRQVKGPTGTVRRYALLAAA